MCCGYFVKRVSSVANFVSTDLQIKKSVCPGFVEDEECIVRGFYKLSNRKEVSAGCKVSTEKECQRSAGKVGFAECRATVAHNGKGLLQGWNSLLVPPGTAAE